MPDDYYPVPGYIPPRIVYDRDRDVLMFPPPPPGAPAPPVRPPTRTRMGVEECTLCGLAVQYCRCADRSPDVPSNDAGDAARLDQRIREARAQLGCPLCGRDCAGRCE